MSQFQIHGKQIVDNSIILNGSNGSIGNKINITGDWLIGDNAIISTKSVAEFENDKEYITKEYAKAILNGLEIKEPVKCATTENISISTPPTIIDTYILLENDRILLKNQTTASENGIYTYSTSGLIRATDFDENTPINEVVSGSSVDTLDGDVNKYKRFVLATPNPITIGTTEQLWIVFNLGVESLSALNDIDFGILSNSDVLMYDGSNWVNTAINVDSNFQHIVYVDPNGTDDVSSGQLFHPYKTIEYAKNNTTISALIIVNTGTYNITENLAKAGISYYFMTDTVINNSTIYPTFDVTDFVLNVRGYGKFFNTNTKIINIANTGYYEAIFECDSCYSNSTMFELNTDLKISINNIIYTGTETSIIINDGIVDLNKINIVNNMSVTLNGGKCYLPHLEYSCNTAMIIVNGGVLYSDKIIHNQSTASSANCIEFNGGNIIFNGASIEKNSENAYFIYSTVSNQTIDVYAAGITVINGSVGELLNNSGLYTISNRTGGGILYTL